MKPKACFCEYDLDDLIDVGYKRYVKNIPTVELMEKAISEKEKDEICLISMLDIDEDNLAEVMGDLIVDEKCHILSCRRLLRKQIGKKLGIEVGNK